MLTAEHLRLRIHAAMPVGGQSLVKSPDAIVESGLVRPGDRKWTIRLKEHLVERILPALNLTSYNNLLRSQARVLQRSQERDRLLADLARLTAELETTRRELQEERDRASRVARPDLLE